MFVRDIDTKTTTVINYIAPVHDHHSSYTAAKILFADDFDHKALPKSVRAHKLMTIDCTPREGNQRNETGLKRLARIKKALEGTKVEVVGGYSNSVTEEEFMAIAS